MKNARILIPIIKLNWKIINKVIKKEAHSINAMVRAERE